jgi:predicted oxidoreductase
MEYIHLSETLRVSRFIQGLMRLPSWNFNKYDLLYQIEKLSSLGITTYDNASIYGSEISFGEAIYLKPSIRQKLQIITKSGLRLETQYPDTSKEYLIKSVEKSLINLKTDYIDLLLIQQPDPFINPFEVSEAFNYLLKSGKVLNFGVANYPPSSFNLLQKFVKEPLVTNQIELSLLNLKNFVNGTLELCQEYEIPPMIWGVLDGGKIFTSSDEALLNICDKLEEIGSRYNINTLETIIYAFFLSHPANLIPIIGTSKINRVTNALKALEIKLTRKEWFEIYYTVKGYI